MGGLLLGSFLNHSLHLGGEILGVRPGRGASFSKPAIPKARNLFRQRATFCAVIPNSAATSLSCFPAAAMSSGVAIEQIEKQLQRIALPLRTRTPLIFQTQPYRITNDSIQRALWTPKSLCVQCVSSTPN